MPAHQLILDWRMVRGATFTNAVVEQCCCITPKQLYRQRKQLHYKHRGWFTYGEAITLVMVNAARMPISEKRAALRALASLLDQDSSASPLVYVGIAYRDGEWWPFATNNVTLAADVVLLSHLPTVSESLASVHAVMYQQRGVTQASAS